MEFRVEDQQTEHKLSLGVTQPSHKKTRLRLSYDSYCTITESTKLNNYVNKSIKLCNCWKSNSVYMYSDSVHMFSDSEQLLQ